MPSRGWQGREEVQTTYRAVGRWPSADHGPINTEVSPFRTPRIFSHTLEPAVGWSLSKLSPGETPHMKILSLSLSFRFHHPAFPKGWAGGSLKGPSNISTVKQVGKRGLEESAVAALHRLPCAVTLSVGTEVCPVSKPRGPCNFFS